MLDFHQLPVHEVQWITNQVDDKNTILYHTSVMAKLIMNFFIMASIWLLNIMCGKYVIIGLFDMISIPKPWKTLTEMDDKIKFRITPVSWQT